MRPAIEAEQITRHVLRDGDTEISVLSLGAAVQAWTVGGVPVVLGYADPADYLSNPASMGVIVGRVANRISGARFALGGATHVLPANDGENCLHGGPRGFGWRNWDLHPVDDRTVRLGLVSPDGDQGFPGTVRVELALTLRDRTLTYDVTAFADRVTPVNLAQHIYFNLTGRGTIRDHRLTVSAESHTPTGPDLIPLGHVAPVAGTVYDFRTPRSIAEADPHGRGHDGNFVLSGRGPAAVLEAPNGLRLTLDTDQPCLQLYTAGALGLHGTPLPGPEHGPFSALCLEAQGYPDALNQGFPASLCAPDRPYRHHTSIRISPP